MYFDAIHLCQSLTVFISVRYPHYQLYLAILDMRYWNLKNDLSLIIQLDDMEKRSCMIQI